MVRRVPEVRLRTGNFTHYGADDNVQGAGTWTATSLISFDYYGCGFIPALGVDLGDDDLCGGAVKMAVVLDTPIDQFPAVLTVFCIVGPMAPASHNGSAGGEGVTLAVPGIINFNHTGGGRTSTSASSGASGGEPAPAGSRIPRWGRARGHARLRGGRIAPLLPLGRDSRHVCLERSQLVAGR